MNVISCISQLFGGSPVLPLSKVFAKSIKRFEKKEISCHRCNKSVIREPKKTLAVPTEKPEADSPSCATLSSSSWQDDYVEALSRLHLTVTRAYKVNPEINFEVFIHKVDGLSDDHKIEKQRDIHKRANDDLADAGLERIHLSFYLTSIYDHSIFEAFSKVVQKLIPQLPTLENLLNIFISNSGIEKAFLFDVVSKIYIATDSSPVDMQTYELCCDMIDVVIDISCIYGLTDSEAGLPYDKESMAIIHLNNTTVMYLKEVTKFLAMVCFVRKESFERKGLIDYNFHCFKKAIQEVFDVRVKVQQNRKLLSQRRWSKLTVTNGVLSNPR
ncbi:ras-related GTP-binding protein D-like [Anarrhichthys ocellatus]|uniref:ras-related GTP-binding protein D-like n=1 Tax=Anarrhichthys ocellatus TaxID=433405 RepID=UPI0012EE3D46|nr:ras-related GTP-binding protein D-like [Anarrhichthys ocellatus]